MKKWMKFTLVFVLIFAFAACSILPQGGGEKAKIKTTVDASKGTSIDQKYREQLRDSLRTKVRTVWEWEHWRNGELIATWKEGNICTDQGLDALLDIMFHGSTQITAWYILIFESNTTPAAGTTYAVPVFTESAAYDEATRPAWTEAASSSQSITNSANKASFTINASKTIYGAALVGGGTDANTISDTAGGGTMFCASQFTSGAKVVVDDDVLKVTITITAADA